MPPPVKGQKCHPCVRNTVLPMSQEAHPSDARNLAPSLASDLLSVRQTPSESAWQAAWQAVRVAERVAQVRGTRQAQAVQMSTPCVVSYPIARCPITEAVE